MQTTKISFCSFLSLVFFEIKKKLSSSILESSLQEGQVHIFPVYHEIPTLVRNLTPSGHSKHSSEIKGESGSISMLILDRAPKR